MDAQLEHGIAIFGVQFCPRPEIADVHAGSGKQVHIAEDTAQEPHILVFQDRSHLTSGRRAPPGYFRRGEVGGEIEFGRQAAVLAVTNLFAVHPQVEGRIDAVEDDEHLPPLPACGDGKGGAVGSGFVGILLDMRRIALIKGIIRLPGSAGGRSPAPASCWGQGCSIPLAEVEIWRGRNRPALRRGSAQNGIASRRSSSWK